MIIKFYRGFIKSSAYQLVLTSFLLLLSIVLFFLFTFQGQSLPLLFKLVVSVIVCVVTYQILFLSHKVSFITGIFSLVVVLLAIFLLTPVYL